MMTAPNQPRTESARLFGFTGAGTSASSPRPLCSVSSRGTGLLAAGRPLNRSDTTDEGGSMSPPTEDEAPAGVAMSATLGPATERRDPSSQPLRQKQQRTSGHGDSADDEHRPEEPSPLRRGERDLDGVEDPPRGCCRRLLFRSSIAVTRGGRRVRLDLRRGPRSPTMTNRRCRWYPGSYREGPTTPVPPVRSASHRRSGVSSPRPILPLNPACLRRRTGAGRRCPWQCPPLPES